MFGGVNCQHYLVRMHSEGGGKCHLEIARETRDCGKIVHEVWVDVEGQK